MKKRILLTALTVLMIGSAVSCKKDKKINITGEWELADIEFATKSAKVGDETVNVYINFVKDGTFSLYQQLGEGRYSSFTGTYLLTGNLLTGKYSDGSAWGSSYDVDVEKGTLTMTSTTGGDVYTYTSCTIPASVISE